MLTVCFDGPGWHQGHGWAVAIPEYGAVLLQTDTSLVHQTTTGKEAVGFPISPLCFQYIVFVCSARVIIAVDLISPRDFLRLCFHLYLSARKKKQKHNSSSISLVSYNSLALMQTCAV